MRVRPAPVWKFACQVRTTARGDRVEADVAERRDQVNPETFPVVLTAARLQLALRDPRVGVVGKPGASAVFRSAGLSQTPRTISLWTPEQVHSERGGLGLERQGSGVRRPIFRSLESRLVPAGRQLPNAATRLRRRRRVSVMPPACHNKGMARQSIFCAVPPLSGGAKNSL